MLTRRFAISAAPCCVNARSLVVSPTAAISALFALVRLSRLAGIRDR
jgi:hypothetical protein